MPSELRAATPDLPHKVRRVRRPLSLRVPGRHRHMQGHVPRQARRVHGEQRARGVQRDGKRAGEVLRRRTCGSERVRVERESCLLVLLQ